jgi:hypothetical protein
LKFSGELTRACAASASFSTQVCSIWSTKTLSASVNSVPKRSLRVSMISESLANCGSCPPLPSPAIERYAALADDDARERFRAALTAFARVYAFLAQIVPFSDADLEQLYTYSRFLALRLPREQTAALDLSDDVVLTHLRTELIGEHDLSLTEGGGLIGGFTVCAYSRMASSAPSSPHPAM